MIKRIYHWWKNYLHHWHGEIIVLVNIFKHPEIPFFARSIVLVLMSYILSPIDIIPDFIPFVGHIDDFLLIPVTFWMIGKITPDRIIQEVRKKVAEEPEQSLFKGWKPKVGIVVAVIIWVFLTWWIMHMMGFDSHLPFVK